MEKPNVGEICWYELVTPNSRDAREFYGKVFNWEFIDHDVGGTTYTMIRKNGKDFGGICAKPNEEGKDIQPHWIAYIFVEDAEEALKKAKDHGAKVIRPVSNVGDFGLYAIIQDPTGANIALWQSLKVCQESA